MKKICCPHCNGTGLVSPSLDTISFPSGVKIQKATLQVEEASIYGTTGIFTAAPLLMINGSEKLGDKIFASDFMPKDSFFKYLRCSPELVKRIEKIQRAVGYKVDIKYGYRPPEYNRKLGGVSNSTHIDGLAADIRVLGLETACLYKACEIMIGEDGGVGFYPNEGFCHIDVRGYKARWKG